MTSAQLNTDRAPAAVGRPDLMVVSHAGFTSINRNVYVRLADRGYQVELVIPESLPDFNRAADPPRPEDPPIHWVRIHGTNQRFWDFIGLLEAIESRRPRVVLLEADPASRLAVRLSNWCRRNGAALICSTNENNLLPLRKCLPRGDWKGAIRTLRSRFLTLLTHGAVSHVYVLCDAAVESMKVLGYNGKTSKIPLGFDPQVFFPDATARERIRSRHNLQHPTVAYIGRMVRGKGVEFLIDALEILNDLEWHFLVDDFVSNELGDYADEIQQRISSSQRVAARTLRFHADHYEIAGYINAADIIVAPSCLLEQYGRILAEAMACGKVVIASDAGAYPELVGGCGIIVPQRDAKALAAALRKAMTNSSFAEGIQRKARERAVRALSLDVQADMIGEHLNKLSGKTHNE